MQSRESKGLEIAKHASIAEMEDGSFEVPSQTDRAVSYGVRVIGQTWACDCPDFVNRADRIDACKHVFAVKFWIAARVELRNEPKPKVFAEDAVQCDKCGSIRVIRYGKTPTKQTYWCKDCSHKFTPSLLKKSRYSPETVSLTLDLYFSGMSLRKISRTLSDHLGTRMSAATIYRWIQKFVPKISEYANTLTPQLSETWHADELFVKMRGGHVRQGKGKAMEHLAYLWNVMDRDTRFLLASRLSTYRNNVGAIGAFREADNNSHGQQPKRVIADSHGSYIDGVAYGFGGETKPRLVRYAGVNKTHKNNNRIERLNGTLRERVKVQRGWKTLKTPLAEGQRIHYNFVKPHQALDGRTPAQFAGVGVEGNKWLTLLRAALTNQNETEVKNN
ncbi:MAG: IS1/IS6 family transposase [Nitrososphaerota archaeon]|nr:IS1/IS6 family transposase [Nitrososphaerota archaeon]